MMRPTIVLAVVLAGCAAPSRGPVAATPVPTGPASPVPSTSPADSGTPGAEDCSNGRDDDSDGAVDCDDGDCAAFPLCPADGADWVAVGPPVGGLAAKAMASDGQGRLYASVTGGLWRSDDAGVSFTSVGDIELLHAIEVSPTGVVLGGADAAPTLYRSDDGASFEAIAVQDVCALRLVSKVSGFAFAPSGTIVAGTGWLPVWRSTFRSLDEGLTWADAAQCQAGVNTVVTGIGANAAGTMVSSTEGQGTLASNDDGLTWTVSDMTFGQQGYDVLADAAGNFFLAAQGLGVNGVWSAGPDGLAWTQQLATGERPTRMALGPSGELFVGTELGSVWWSTDGGVTWDTLPPLPVSSGASGFVWDVVADEAGYLYVSLAAGTGGVFRSTQPWVGP